MKTYLAQRSFVETRIFGRRFTLQANSLMTRSARRVCAKPSARRGLPM
jgi:hypothetical protein